MALKRILSVSGGGIRGIIPCCAMVEIERQTGKQIRQLASMMAGTSTGALLASGLAAGVAAKDLLEVYTKRSKEIFTGIAPTAKMLALGNQYDSASIYRVLESVFGPAARWTMNDCPIPVLLTAKGVDNHPWYFIKGNSKNSGATGPCSLLDCATASAAAPTYFDPWYVHPGKVVVGWCFDGGVGITGNPVHQACLEAFRYGDLAPESTRVLSFGTGYYPNRRRNPPSGFLETLTWTIDALTGGPEEEQRKLVDLYYPGIQQVFDAELPAAIDMADTGSIPTLVEVGQKAAAAVDWVKVLAE